MRVSAHANAEFETHRRVLFGIAYRMLGTVSDAEDVVQDAYLRYRSAIERGVQIASPRAYLCAVVSRLAIDTLRSARVRREEYSGEWLPEPVLTDEHDPAWVAEQADSISMAALLLLERLSPEQRAAFVLHDVFGYSFEEVAQVIERTEPTCRQLAARARRHMRAGKPRFETTRRQQRELARRFFDALGNGDVDGLVDMLTADIEVHGDGGGKAPQWDRPIVGAAKAARLLVSVGKLVDRLGLSFEFREINHAPGAVVRDGDGRVASIMSLEIADGRVQTVRSITNPDKLRHLGPVADAADLLRRRATDPGTA